MSENVISHQEAHGKRERARSWPIRRVGAIVVTVLGILAASWLAPEAARRPAASAPEPVRIVSHPAPPVAPEAAVVDINADLAGPPLRRVSRTAPRNNGVPLNAAGALRTDDFEILSAAELDGISQARD